MNFFYIDKKGRPIQIASLAVPVFFICNLILFIFLIPVTTAAVSVNSGKNTTYGVNIFPSTPQSTTSTNSSSSVHNNLTGLQGGTSPNEYYHINQSVYNKLLSTINAWITGFIETDPESVHRDGSTPLTANWDAGLYNITADWFKGNINWSDVQNAPSIPTGGSPFQTTSTTIYNNTANVNLSI